MKVDPTKQFLRYQENCFNFLSWQELTEHRRVLFVSITRHKSLFVPQYVRHLNLWARVYQQWGVDQVVLIVPGDRYMVLAVNTMTSHLLVLGDINNEFVNALAQHTQCDHDPVQLSRYWNYQVLINQGQVERFYSQPMDSLVINLLKHSKDISLVKGIRPIERFHLTPFFLQKTPELMQQVLYYNLYPNTDLKNYLLTTAR